MNSSLDTEDSEYPLTLTSDDVAKNLPDFNATSYAEVECLFRFVNQSISFTESQLRCNVRWDGLSCWPTTVAGDVATIPCFHELNGVLYDVTQNASRACLENGTWANRSDYSQCKPLKHPDEFLQVLWGVEEASTIYYIGYGVSFVAVTIALFIFLYFKDLRCVRNTIHTNLMVTYLLTDVTWIITATLQSSTYPTGNKVACFLVILLTYLMVTNFFWMFVEGLYLYILVVKTFSRELVAFYVYAFIGWGLPAVVVAIWAPIKGHLSTTYGAHDSTICPWQTKDHFDNIFGVPVMLALVVNIIFLGKIMWVLITKLRAATTMESKQYRKASKALLVLIPLLGVTYILVLVTPNEDTARVVFTYIQTALLSTQGLTVAVLYCFLNGEVQKSVLHHWERWLTVRTLRDNPRHSLTYRSSNLSEGMKLYNTGGERDRGSCISFTTTTTFVSNNCHRYSTGQRQPSNGFAYGLYGPTVCGSENAL